MNPDVSPVDWPVLEVIDDSHIVVLYRRTCPYGPGETARKGPAHIVREGSEVTFTADDERECLHVDPDSDDPTDSEEGYDDETGTYTAITIGASHR